MSAPASSAASSVSGAERPQIFTRTERGGEVLARLGGAKKSAKRPPHQHRGGQILDRGTDGFEQRDLGCLGAALGLAAAELEQVAADAGLFQHARLQRLRNVAALLRSAGARIDID